MLLEIKNRPDKYTNKCFILKYKNKDGTFYDTKGIFMGVYDSALTLCCEYCFLIEKKYFGGKDDFISDCGDCSTNGWTNISKNFPINEEFSDIISMYITEETSDKLFVWVREKQIVELRLYSTFDFCLEQINKELLT